MFKKIVVLLLVLMGVFSIVGYCYCAEEISMGWYGPLTGPNSLSGTASKNAAALAIEQINSKGGINGYKIKLIVYDDKSSPEEAVNAVTRLVSVDGVHCIVGSLHSGNILASAPVVEKAQIPEIGTGTSPVWLQKGYKYLFRSLPNSDLGNIRLSGVMKEMGVTRVGVLRLSDEYGKVGATDLIDRLKEKGIETVVEESHDNNDIDFTGQITKIMNTGIDGFVIYTTGEYIGLIMRQIRQLGYDGYVYGTEGFTLPEVREIAGPAANGAIYNCAYVIPDTPEDATNELEKQFLLSYMDKYGNMPESDNSYRAYDAVKIFEEAISNANSLEGPAIRDAIENITNFEGLAGTFNFKGNHGEGISACRIYVIEDGKNVVYEKWVKNN